MFFVSFILLDSPEMINNNQSSTSSLSRSPNDPLHEQRLMKEESQLEHSVPESYHQPPYEYMSSGVGGGGGGDGDGGGNNNNQYSFSHPRTSSPSSKYPTKSLPSSSYSPTSYRYPPASVIDESTLSTYSINRSAQQQQPHQQQLSSSSLSAYAPQHNYNNNSNLTRQSLLPTTSDDSGNESSINYHHQQQQQHHLANNTHFVVVAIDFGTTFSGYAFAFTRDIDSILMMRKVDGNDPGKFHGICSSYIDCKV